MTSIRSVAVFCGSKNGNNPLFTEQTIQLGYLLAQQGIDIIYGGSNKGLMSALANAALELNGRVTGIIPEALTEWEHHHKGITELLIVDTMHTRKKMLYERCDAAIILPGGYGTLDEVFEFLTWNQLNIHDKKLFFLNTDGFYDHLIAHILRMHDEDFLYGHPDEKMTILSSPEQILPFL